MDRLKKLFKSLVNFEFKTEMNPLNRIFFSIIGVEVSYIFFAIFLLAYLYYFENVAIENLYTYFNGAAIFLVIISVLYLSSFLIILYKKTYTLKRLMLGTVIFLIIILGLFDLFRNIIILPANIFPLISFYVGVVFNIIYFKVDIKDFKKRFFYSQEVTINNIILIFSITLLLLQATEIFRLFHGQIIRLLAPIFLFSIYFYRKYEKKEDILVIASIVFAILIYSFQIYDENLGKDNAIISLNRSNCLLASSTSVNLSNSQLGTRRTYNRFNVEGYQQNLGYIFQNGGVSSGDNYLNFISRLQYANGLSDSIESLNNGIPSSLSNTQAIMASKSVTEENDKQLRLILQEINQACLQINVSGTNE